MQSDGDEVRIVLDDLRRLFRVLRESHGEAQTSAGLSAAQLFVLQALAAEKKLTVNQLAERTYTHQSSVSVVAAKLAERGLIARVRSTRDARHVEITLTAAGRDAIRRAPRAPQERIVQGIEKLSPESRRRLAASLDELLRAMGVSGPAEMFFAETDQGVPPEAPKRRRRAPS